MQAVSMVFISAGVLRSFRRRASAWCSSHTQQRAPRAASDPATSARATITRRGRPGVTGGWRSRRRGPRGRLGRAHGPISRLVERGARPPLHRPSALSFSGPRPGLIWPSHRSDGRLLSGGRRYLDRASRERSCDSFPLLSFLFLYGLGVRAGTRAERRPLAGRWGLDGKRAASLVE